MVQDFKLTYLLCSRFCHDLAAPLSAVSIGIDMLPTTEGIDCLQYSIKAAIGKLELFRCLAGGHYDSSESPSLTEAVSIINKSIDCEKIQIDWLCKIDNTIFGNGVRLIMAVILIAIDALPKGGRILIHPDFSIELNSQHIKLHEEIIDILKNGESAEELTSRGAIGYFAYLLSHKLKTQVQLKVFHPNQIIFRFS